MQKRVFVKGEGVPSRPVFPKFPNKRLLTFDLAGSFGLTVQKGLLRELIR